MVEAPHIGNSPAVTVKLGAPVIVRFCSPEGNSLASPVKFVALVTKNSLNPGGRLSVDPVNDDPDTATFMNTSNPRGKLSITPIGLFVSIEI